jgi:parvulin-like peptidyl-prolyl isomerase
VGTGNAEIREQIVAVVNDDIITYSELEKILSPIFEHYERIYSGADLYAMMQKARRDVLQHLINEKLILQEAHKQNVRDSLGDVFTEEVERSMSEMKSKFGSEDEFIAKLKAENIDIGQLRTKQEELTLVKALLMKEVSSKCTVAPAEVRDYYEKNRSEFADKERLHVSQIWIKEKEGEPGAAGKKAEEALKKIKSGKTFEEVAREYSEGPYAGRGGDWGFIAKGHWNSELENIAIGLAPGTRSDVVKTSLGYHIIKLHERTPPSVKPLNEVYAAIEHKLFTERADKRRAKWLDGLRKKAYIAVMD